MPKRKALPLTAAGVISAINRIAREMGVEGVFVVRGAENARLEFNLPVSAQAARELALAHNVGVGTVKVSPILELADAPLLLVLRFSQTDDHVRPGVEQL